MSAHSTLDRRELLKRAAYLLGGAISTPAMMGILQGCSAKKPDVSWSPTFFTDAQAALVTEVAEIMIPRTDTPGAKDVGVPAFIDTMLENTYRKNDQDRYLAGLERFESQAKDARGKPFLELAPEQRAAFVREQHDAALQAAWSDTTGNEHNNRPFILMTKELAVLGFFTSEAGATQVLQYVAVPGPYRARVPLAEAGNGKTWATD
jgi:gluconate 2-dehydrogenase gamma chain